MQLFFYFEGNGRNWCQRKREIGSNMIQIETKYMRKDKVGGVYDSLHGFF